MLLAWLKILLIYGWTKTQDMTRYGYEDDQETMITVSVLSKFIKLKTKNY